MVLNGKKKLAHLTNSKPFLYILFIILKLGRETEHSFKTKI